MLKSPNLLKNPNPNLRTGTHMMAASSPLPPGPVQQATLHEGEDAATPLTPTGVSARKDVLVGALCRDAVGDRRAEDALARNDARVVGLRVSFAVFMKWPAGLRRHLHLAVPKGRRRRQPCSTGERAGPGPAPLLRRAPPPRRDEERAAASRPA
jgi:hypothetical protein